MTSSVSPSEADGRLDRTLQGQDGVGGEKGAGGRVTVLTFDRSATRCGQVAQFQVKRVLSGYTAVPMDLFQ